MDQKSINITPDLLQNLENSNRILSIETENDFLEIINQDRVIIYFLVDWSGPERLSRYIVYKALNGINKSGTPVFKIDCSEETKEYIVNWLIRQRAGNRLMYYGGWGETMLISKSNIIDMISNPAHLGYEKTRQKLAEWKLY